MLKRHLRDYHFIAYFGRHGTPPRMKEYDACLREYDFVYREIEAVRKKNRLSGISI
jgi:hypothetical protein